MRLHVTKILQETSEAITLFFELPKGVDYVAGQFIKLKVVVDGQTYYRCYSFSSSPLVDPLPSITVKRVKGGIVSNFLNDHVAVGDVLEALPPSGDFVLPKVEGVPSFLFIGGGSGITPLYAMMKEALASRPDALVYLIYANHNMNAIIYRQALHDLSIRYGKRCRVVDVLSQPEQGWQGLTGRLTPDSLLSLIEGVPAETYYFLCGPGGLMKMVSHTLLGEGVKETSILHETFISLEDSSDVSEGVAARVSLSYDDELYTYEVKEDETLLDGALAQGIDLPYACGTGICDTCRAKCVKGKVKMVVDEGLSEEEKEEGYILTCVAHATTPEVEIVVEEEEA